MKTRQYCDGCQKEHGLILKSACHPEAGVEVAVDGDRLWGKCQECGQGIFQMLVVADTLEPWDGVKRDLLVQ